MYNRILSNDWDFSDYIKNYTHVYHKYPAMMAPPIVNKIINDFKPTNNPTIFDPFMGSGTTILEANILNLDSFGFDINPLAILITKTKITHFDVNLIQNIYSDIINHINKYNSNIIIPDSLTNNLTNHSYWYDDFTLSKLYHLYSFIININDNAKNFFILIFSELLRDSSFTKKSEFKRYKMPVDKLLNFKPNPFNDFINLYNRNFNALIEFNNLNHNPNSNIFNFNSTIKIPNNIINDNSIDMIITSPPYGDSNTTVAYGQFSSWSNQWLNKINSNFDKLSMGAKNYKNILPLDSVISNDLLKLKNSNYKRYIDVISFLHDYNQSIINISSKLRKNGKACFVVGNRNVSNITINLDYFTANMFEINGFKHDYTFVRTLPYKRMPYSVSPSNLKNNVVNTMNNEYIVILTKL